MLMESGSLTSIQLLERTYRCKYQPGYITGEHVKNIANSVSPDAKEHGGNRFISPNTTRGNGRFLNQVANHQRSVKSYQNPINPKISMATMRIE